MTIIDMEMPRFCFECKLKFRGVCPKLIKDVHGLRRERLPDCPIKEVEAISKGEYESRLKKDMVAMLTEIQLEIEELCTPPAYQEEDYFLSGTNRCSELIQAKINSLKKKAREYETEN